jgi:hypothetical protein
VKLLYTDRKPYPLSYGLRNPYRNLKPKNSQGCAQKPQRNCTFMNWAFKKESHIFGFWCCPALLMCVCVRNGHRHLQIGRMLDIDLISEPPPPPPRCIYSKCGNLCGQRGRKLAGVSRCYIFVPTPHAPPPPPQGRGQRSKVFILPTSGLRVYHLIAAVSLVFITL